MVLNPSLRTIPPVEATVDSERLSSRLLQPRDVPDLCVGLLLDAADDEDSMAMDEPMRKIITDAPRNWSREIVAARADVDRRQSCEVRQNTPRSVSAIEMSSLQLGGSHSLARRVSQSHSDLPTSSRDLSDIV